MITLNEYLMLSGILFSIGFVGIILRRSVLVIFMCLELMLSAVNLTLIAFSRFNAQDAASGSASGLPDYDPQVLVLFIMTIAAAEVAIGLAMIVALYRGRQTVNTDELTALKD